MITRLAQRYSKCVSYYIFSYSANMECPVHTDQTVIMVCRSQECDSTFICVHCIAGPHNGHQMTTLEETGKDARERLKDMSVANIEFIKDKE